MPRYGRRRRYRFPRFRLARRQRGGNWIKAAYTGLKIAKRVRSMVNVEYKVFETTLDHTTATTGSLQCLNEIVQGDSGSNRDGSQVKNVSIRIKGQLIPNSSVSDTTSVRCMLLLVTSQDASDPTLATAELGVLQTASMNAMPNIYNRNRYILLWDQTFRIGMPGQPNSVVNIDKYFKRTLKSVYAGSTTDAPRKNSLWFITLTDEITYPCDFEGFSRIRFIDN